MGHTTATKDFTCGTWGGEMAQLVRAQGRRPWGQGVRISITAITCSYAAIHLTAVYNL